MKAALLLHSSLQAASKLLGVGEQKMKREIKGRCVKAANGQASAVCTPELILDLFLDISWEKVLVVNQVKGPIENGPEGEPDDRSRIHRAAIHFVRVMVKKIRGPLSLGDTQHTLIFLEDFSDVLPDPLQFKYRVLQLVPFVSK